MKTMKIPDKKTVEARLSKPRKSEFFVKFDGEKTTTRINGDLVDLVLLLVSFAEKDALAKEAILIAGCSLQKLELMIKSN